MTEQFSLQAIEAAATRRWQARLLPGIVVALAVMALFFFASTFIQLQRLNASVEYRPDPVFAATIAAIDARASELPAAEAAEALRWKTLVLLERETIAHRYAQVNATLLLRAWTRHLGFVTGMMLAFTGAIFVLAKLSEDETRIGGTIGGNEANVASRSPGIILAVLGTALMLTTILVNFGFETRDVPVYIGPAAAAATAGATADIPPPDLDEPPPAEAAETTGKPSDAQAPPLLATP